MSRLASVSERAFPQRVGLRLCAASPWLQRSSQNSTVTNQSPERDLQIEGEALSSRGTGATLFHHAAHLDTEHYRILHHGARVEFDDGFDQRPAG